MNYRESLDFLYSRLPMFTRIGEAAYRKDLHNTLELCRFWNNPQDHFKSIHVAGTNGKGSVSHMLAAIFQQAGYRTGLYTSPHLYDFRERIRVNGEMIPEADVVQFTAQLVPKLDTLDPSFFEVTVAMAFDHFRREKVDIAIIETGLGGRLDSTNIIQPELSIITNIGWDHMHLLGDSLEKIAFEKAGIIKKDTPVVIGQSDPLTRSVFEQKAASVMAPAFFATDRLQIKKIEEPNEKLQLAVSDGRQTTDYLLDLTGHYQQHNLLTVLQAIEVLRKKGWTITKEALQQGLSHTKALTHLMGRWEKIGHAPDIIIDVAHNANGMQEVMLQLARISYRRLHFITGMVKDKEVKKVLALLPKTALYYFTQAHLPRAMPAEELAMTAADFELSGSIFPNVNIALEEARKLAEPTDLILICGSIFLAAEVNKKAD